MTTQPLAKLDIARMLVSLARQTAFAAIAFAVGAVLALYIFPLDLLLDRWAWWDKIYGDNATGLVGYLFFAQDEWRWPLFHTVLLDPPGGVNIIYTDPVPIAALLGKIVFKLTGILPIYMGAWMFLSYGLQSLVSYLIFRQIGLRPAVALAAAAMMPLVPAFIFRLHHIGLVAHFIILAAILFYLRAVTVASRREMALSAVAVGGILFVNPYLLAMSATIFNTGLMEAARRNRISWREVCALIALMVGVASSLAFAFGIIGQGNFPLVGGFGIYSMNLASPVIPQLSAIPGFESYVLDMTGGQYEGFNYFGAGLLLLILVALVFRFGAVRLLVTNHRFLAVVLIGLTVFAASSEFYLGSWHIINVRYERWPVLKTLTSVFRCSGRFFWPVSYFLIIGAITVLAKSMAQRAVLLLIGGSLVVQLIDIQPLLNHSIAGNLPYPELVDREAWARAIASHDEMTINPDYYCLEPVHHPLVTQLQLLAARAHVPVNAAYVSRKTVDCSKRPYLQRLDAASVTRNPLIVIFKKEFPPEVLTSSPADGFICRDATFAFVCSRQGDNPAFFALGRELQGPSIGWERSSRSSDSWNLGTSAFRVYRPIARYTNRWSNGIEE